MEYQLGQDPVAAIELGSIRSGQGYFDLEGDLRRLAVGIRSNPTVLAQDRFPRVDDAETCVRLADALAAEFASEAAAPNDWLSRVHVAIFQCYHREVLQTAAWLYRKTPSALTFYPSIYSGGRPRAAGSTEPLEASTETISDEPETV
ncbi:MAG: hypothetical protein AUK47_18540 [Deltaproteobacteria bacterium CG2_30_63_29]|nr:MAG: hypothetical protein AUK47_18540 [Deltaproteobacteria bacterium CG2_30_63_29]PIV98631.1 MAG: hypothetical protein COW42_13720 [Deltaproteobacteria bacterium CG17_big_fil_post_rev_8_21_14_2_50_63_7]PJB43178.1 MAG: hypothetical protein CO108_10485 [Deltaproteobacteria bacterium CG_4_9_14_3_um_filter_63_12]